MKGFGTQRQSWRRRARPIREQQSFCEGETSTSQEMIMDKAYELYHSDCLDKLVEMPETTFGGLTGAITPVMLQCVFARFGFKLGIQKAS